MLRLSDNPPTSFCADNADGLADVAWQSTWRVAYTRPRQEKSLARDLIQRNVSYFLPMVMRETSSGGRRRRNMHPLFPSYLFFAGDERARLACLRTERLVKVIEPSGEEQYRLREELRTLAKYLATNPQRVELSHVLVPGTHVRVTCGPLRDVEGTIAKVANEYKLHIAVSLLGVGVVVEIHPDLVEAF